MGKKERHAAILKIISEYEVTTQEELCEKLKERGFEAAQATVSRDMSELKINKDISDSGVSRYYVGGRADGISYSSIFAQSVVSIDYAMNTVVVRCHAGMAPAAGRVIDEQGFGCVVGSIAGDDTVFVLTRSESHSVQLVEMLKGLLAR